MKKMRVVYTNESPPKSFSRSIFLAGPTPRDKNTKSWRPTALKLLRKLGYDGVVFVPEMRRGVARADYTDQVEWEDRHLNMADCILFWIPRELKAMPALTTNTEWGVWQTSGKVVFGAPKKAEKVSYQHHYAYKLCVPCHHTLQGTVQLAINMISPGSKRSGGEREIPLIIWCTPQFQNWYSCLKTAGNKLDGAEVKWTHLIGKDRKTVFCWALKPRVYIAMEKRFKTNEIVLSRPDITGVVMYHKDGAPDQTDIVIVREFRSPAATEDGYVWEIPSGSSYKYANNPRQVAANECQEETGLKIELNRLISHCPRQLAATFSTHKSHLFSVEITDEEMDYLHSQKGIAHGIPDSSEKTFVEIVRLSDLLKNSKIDWAVLGMVLYVMSKI